MSTMLARVFARLTKGRGPARRPRICKAAAGDAFAKCIQSIATTPRIFIAPTTPQSIVTPTSTTPTLSTLALSLLLTSLAATSHADNAAIYTRRIGINVTPTTELEVSGTISATSLRINGVSITGAGASPGDYIASGTTKVTTNQTGYVSFTTGGTTTGYMDTSGRFIIPGVSTTGPISATSLLASGGLTVSNTAWLGKPNSTTAYQDEVYFGNADVSSPNMTIQTIGAPAYSYTNFKSTRYQGKFDFGANHNTGAATFMRINGGVANGSDLSLFNYGSTNVNGVIASASTVFLSTSGTSYLNGGNVGIGTTSPGYTLDVNGNIKARNSFFSGSTGFPGILYLNRSNDGSTQSWLGYSSTNSNTEIQIAAGGNNSYLTFLTTAVERMRIVSSGLVGIGTTTPTTHLEVIGTISATGLIINGVSITGSGSSPGDYIASGTTKVTANTTGYISFTTGGTTTGYMDSAGNFILPGVSTTGPVSATNGYFSGPVVMGTSTTDASLRINIPTASTGYAVTSTFIGGSVDQKLFQVLRNSNQNPPATNPFAAYAAEAYDSVSSTYNRAYFGLRKRNTTATPNGEAVISAPRDFAVYVANENVGASYGTEAMRIVSTGNVGIGTSTPNAPLHVSTSQAYVAQFGTSAYSTQYLALRSNTSGAMFGLDAGTYGNSSGIVRIQGGLNKGIGFSVSNTSFASGTTDMLIDSTGNVGIGSSAPSTTLTVVGSSASIISVFRNWNGGHALIEFGNPSASIYAGMAPNGNFGIGSSNLGATGFFTVQRSTGNVGIGTVTPTTALEVSGTISATRFVGDGSGLTGIVGASSGDNIASGTTKVTTNQTGYVSFTTGGTTTGYMDTAGNFVLPGVSATGRISATSFNPEIIPLKDLSDVSASNSLGSLYIGAGVGVTGNPSSTDNVGVGSAMFTSTGMSGAANTGLGRYVMANLSTGTGNTGIGRGSLWQTTTGSYNASVGFASMFTNATGGYNSSIGAGALTNMTDGWYNVAMGANAAAGTDSVSQSVFIGHQAGYGVSGTTTGLLNEVMIGFKAGYSITTGGYNTFIGTNAGYNVTSGGGNIMIGAQTYAPTATSSNALNIGNLIYASGLVASVSTGSGVGKVGINYVTPSVALEVSGTVSATRFVGDGSGLTGIVGASSGDNIASGTTKVTANSTGYVSFTTGGTTTGYMDTAGNFMLPGVSTTSSVSASGLFSSGRVVVGPTPVGVNNSNTLEVSGTIYTQNTGIGDTSGSTATAATFLQSVVGSDASPHNVGLAIKTLRDRDVSANGWNYTTTRLTRVLDTSTAKQNWIAFINRSSSGDNVMAFGEGASEEWMRIDNGKMGIGTQTPTTPLEVSGTISATRFVGDGSGLTGIVGASSGDNIASGTTKVTANQTGYISFTTGGTTTGYMNTAGVFVVPGISATGAISGTTAAFSNSLSVTGSNGIYSTGVIYGNNGFALPDSQIVYWGSGYSKIDGDGTNNGGKYLRFFTSSTEAMRIVSTGYVGIGTTAPTEALHVAGNIRASNNVFTGTTYASGGFYVNALSGTVRWNGANNSIFGDATATSQYISINTSGTEAMRIVSTGYVGIGTTTPGMQLSLAGSSASSAIVSLQNNGNSGSTGYSGINFYNNVGSLVAGLIHSNSATSILPGSIWLGSRVNEPLYLVAGTISPTVRLTVLPSGPVGIGTTAPTTALEVSGTISATSLRSSGDIEYSGTLRDTSDRRLKTNIEPLPYNDVLGRVMLLKPVQYERRAVPGRIEWGFIAQDVEQQFPQLVTAANDASGTLSISYLGLLAPMTQAIQELKADNDNLRAQVGTLKAANDNLTSRLDAQQQKLEAQQRDIDALKKSAGLN